MTDGLTINEAAETTGWSPRMLRYLERVGLVEPARTPGGSRLYSRADIDRLQRIKDLLGEGLNLAGIARVLELEAEVGRLRQENEALRRPAATASRGPSRSRR